MENDNFLLTLLIDGRKYPMRINSIDEEAFRAAAKEINERIKRYRIAYGERYEKVSLDTQDLVTLTAIQALVENFSLEKRNDTKPYEDKIKNLLETLDSYLIK